MKIKGGESIKYKSTYRIRLTNIKKIRLKKLNKLKEINEKHTK